MRLQASTRFGELWPTGYPPRAKKWKIDNALNSGGAGWDKLAWQSLATCDKLIGMWGYTLVEMTVYFLLQSSYLFCQLPSELTVRNSTKLWHVFGSEPDLKMCVQNLCVPPTKNCGPQNYLHVFLMFSDDFAIKWRLKWRICSNRKWYRRQHWKLQSFSYIISEFLKWSDS